MNDVLAPLKRAIQYRLRQAGYSLQRLSADERTLFQQMEARAQAQDLDTVFGEELAQLQDLRRRYAEVRLPVAVHSVWGGKKSAKGAQSNIGWGGLDLRRFRGHNAYVWDYAGQNLVMNQLRYHVYAECLRQDDPAGLLAKLDEDGAFGCFTYDHPSLGPVSRDRLDSVRELTFLQRCTGLLDHPEFRVLDVGAGYGRMAWRTLTAMPALGAYTCVDAVPESTFLSRFFLKHRGLADRAEVLALDELESRIAGRRYDLALNIHSFSECTFVAIEWWLRALCRLHVRYLMIVPNEGREFLSMEADRTRRNYRPLLESLGFRERACEPVFAQPAVQQIMGVRDCLFLFERSDA